MRTRKTTRDDIPALKALWEEAFGDEEQDIDAFFETLYPGAIGFCAEESGVLCAMLFALPQTIVKGEKQLKSAYLYAVATKKEYRGRGYCKALMAYAEKELRKRYFEAAMLSPASETLADFYAEQGYTRQGGVRRVLTACPKSAGQATVIGVQDYAGLRETMLWDVAHVRYDKAQLEYALSGGQCYCLMNGFSMGCAMMQRRREAEPVRVRELLPSFDVLPAMAEKLGAGEYEVQTALDQNEGVCWAMLKWLDKAYPELEPVYMGFALE